MKQKSLATAKAVDALPGIVRRTLAYNDDTMLCRFDLKAGSTIPLHNHKPTQIGYILSGRIRFLGSKPADTFEAVEGDGYVFNPDVHHGAEVLEDTVIIEVFSPSRPEYRDF